MKRWACFTGITAILILSACGENNTELNEPIEGEDEIETPDSIPEENNVPDNVNE
ncbi:hypothetical protein [Evansella clarkii]|uniref:hypothetical protein n=1 Tax=Evansella clarkii TaxID=79879 RepID=UPI001431C943|nr:hypothetical protein [Evansella clarkii]